MSKKFIRCAFVIAMICLVSAPLWAVDSKTALKKHVPPTEELPVEQSVEAAFPGPDGFGMTGSMCGYAWVDITGTGTSVLLGDDECGGPFPIGFDFSFYGSTYNEFYVSSNGHMSFGSCTSDLSNDCPIPSANGQNNFIPIMQDDLDPGDNGDPVFYEGFAAGACPYNGYTGACLVVLYDDFCHYPGGAACDSAGTWEAIIFDNGSVVQQFLDAGVEEGSGSTTGIEGDNVGADHGLVYACNAAASITDGLCVQYDVPVAPVLGASVKTSAPAILIPGESIEYNIDISNVGSSDALDTVMEDFLPAGTVFTGGLFCSSGLCFYDTNSHTIGWTGEVLAGDNVFIEFTVVVEFADCGVPLVNTAFITDPAADPVEIEAENLVYDERAFGTDFEADDGGFVAIPPGEWEWGVPTYPPELVAQGAYSGVNVWGTDLDADADDTIGQHILETIVTIPNTIPGYPVVLSWADWNGAEASDERQVWINGELVWAGGLDVDQRFWLQHAIDVSAYGGQEVVLQFILEVCCGDPGPDGWYIDDVFIYNCLPEPGLYLLPDDILTSGCNGIPQFHTFTIDNFTGAAGTFDLMYDVPTANADLFGPPDVTLESRAGTSFQVELTPNACLADGEVVTGLVHADGNGFDDLSVITKVIGSSGDWSFNAGMINPRGDHAVVATPMGVFAIGGTPDGATYDGHNDYYDPVTDTWSAMAPMPNSVTIIDGAAIGDVIFIPGGYDGATALATHQAYDTVGDAWSFGADAPRAVVGYMATSCGGYLYRAGGAPLATFPAGQFDLERYDPGSDTWDVLAPMNTGRSWGSMECISGTTIVVAGGFDETAVATTDVESYDIGTDTWSYVAPMPVDVWGAGSWSDGNQLGMAGGIEVQVTSANVHVYNPTTDTWSMGTPLNDARFRGHAAYLGMPFVIGGWEPVWTPHDSNESLAGDCGLCADLTITKDNAIDEVFPGQPVTYIIEVNNTFGNDAFGATVEDIFGPKFFNVSWICLPSGGGTCSVAGLGDIIDIVDLPVGATLTYVVDANVALDAIGLLENTASIIAPPDILDIDPDSNSATDIDVIMSVADLYVVKTGDANYIPGGVVNFSIEAGNNGLIDVVGADIEDVFPAEVTNVAWTCVAAGGATCSAAGAGDIFDTVDIPVGGTVTYSAVGNVDPGAMGLISNTASVMSAIPDPDPDNNTSTWDVGGPEIFADGFESGDTSAWN